MSEKTILGLQRSNGLSQNLSSGCVLKRGSGPTGCGQVQAWTSADGRRGGSLSMEAWADLCREAGTWSSVTFYGKRPPPEAREGAFY